jgi:predicted TIM-barrel fold metal-dependent hydrolase
MNRVCLGVFLFCAASVPGWAQQPDPEIVSYINSIKAIDNHAHVTALDREHDKGYDQLRCDGLYSSNGLPPANLRFGPDQQAAYKTLYGFEAKTGDEVELKKIAELETAARHEHGADFYAWVLEKAGIDTVFANRTAMAPEMKPPRLQWVAYEDALIFPLDNSRQKTVNPDRRIFYGYAEDLLNTYLQDAGMSRNPPTLDTYVEKVVRPTLQKQKNAGAMAVKFEAAYLRPLDFAPASKDEAARVYAKYAAGGLATPAEYKTLQDFLFEQIALEAGSLRLAVHFHTGSGCGDFFDDAGADAMLLSPILNDPDLRKTNFVLLHANPPRERNVSMLIVKPNVYTDMSVLELLWSPQELARLLRPWLQIMPEHVMFGTDAGPFGPGLEWEETTIIGTQHARRALAIVLSEMVRDGTITLDRAKEIAELVLRKNAIRLYELN